MKYRTEKYLEISGRSIMKMIKNMQMI